MPTRRSGTVSSPGRSAAPAAKRRLLAQDQPRFTQGNFEKNLHIVDEVQAVASELDATPAQVALAWLLAQGDDIAPIPGTKRVSRVEDTAADAIELSTEQIQRLNDLTPPANSTTRRTWPPSTADHINVWQR